MSDGTEDDQAGLRRATTGVPGLDTVLHGGLFFGGAYIVRGAPGAGKTILANQVCFHHVNQGGGRALYVTLLAESHARMLQHMARLAFYESASIPDRLYYVSAFRTLEDDGLKGLMDLLRREMRGHQATLLVLDGLLAIEETSGSDRAFRKFIHELQAYAAIEDCVVLLLTNGSRAEYRPEHTMVDGLITLDDARIGNRRQRELEVVKFRGSGFLRGRHACRITDDGFAVYPRVEARYACPEILDAITSTRVSLGVTQLDAMTGGGPFQGTATMLLGASGTGKTTLGLHYLSRSSAQEPGLCFSFYETPARLVTSAAAVGLDLRPLIEKGHLELLWQPPVEQILDDLGERLLDAVRRRRVRRLFVDGLGGFEHAADQRERVGRIFTALSNELRGLGVTAVYTTETQNLVGPEVTMPVGGVSAMIDNLILLRFVEFRARLHRLISVMKVRGSAFDPTLRAFRITDAGIVFTDAFGDAEAVLSGFGIDRQGNAAGASGQPGNAPSRPRRPR